MTRYDAPASETEQAEQPQQPRQPQASNRSEVLAGVKQGLLIGAVIAAVGLPAVHWYRVTHRVNPVVALAPRAPAWADFAGESASDEARFVANWVADSGDNRKLSFVIIDKRHTKVFVFDPAGKLLGATPVLLGAAPGDDSVTGIGKRPIAEVRPEERTTPAGRFLGEPGRNATGEDVVWVDYDAAVSMHRVRIVDPRERRLERLATPTTDDNRISYGCVNVPVAFYENVLSPVFNGRYGVVYVLPEFKSVREVFATAYDPAQRVAQAQARVAPATASSL